MKIQRSAVDRMLGVSTLVITVAEEEEDPRESTVRIDALEKTVAAGLGGEHIEAGGGREEIQDVVR